MTKEQAIEICNEIIQQNNEIVKQIRLNKDINAMQLTANCDNESLAIETVLSMLKGKDTEIEKKDKIIDLMSEQIKIPEPTMKIESFDIKPKTKFGMRYLNKEEVKQYFEKKVKE